MRRGGPGLLVRLVVATVAAGVVVATIGAILQNNAAEDALRVEILQRNRVLAGELAARLDSRLTNQIDSLRAVANREPVATLSPAAGAELRSIFSVNSFFDELQLYHLDGEVVAAASTREVVDLRELPARADLADRVRSGPSMAIIRDASPQLEVAVPVEFPPGLLRAVLVGRIPFEVVAAPVLRLDTGVDQARFVAAGDGSVLAHPERDRMLAGESFPLVEVADQGGTASIDLAGQGRLVTIANLDTLDAAVVVDQSEAVALAPVRDQLRDLTLILTAVMAVVVLVVCLTGMWLLAPLRPLTVAVGRLGRHERGVRVDDRSPGEVGELASEFNRLAEVLDRRQDEFDELQRLSLLVNTRTSRDEVAAEVADGFVRLLDVDAAAFCTAGERLPEIVASHGDVDEAVVLDQAATAARVGQTHLSQRGSTAYAAIPVETIDGRRVGAVVIAREGGPLEDHERALAETYAAFAGVALENVDRLALEQGLGAELAEAVQQRRSLMSTVSHEFRTPLTCIEGFSSMLLDGWDGYDDAQRRELVAKVHHHSTELDELVSRLLDFAVTERGTLQAQLEDVDLRDLVDEVVSGMRPLLDGRDVIIDVDVDLRVRADPVMLRRALSNLVSNAVKYSPEGSPIGVRAIRGDRIRLEVVDEGVGMSAEDATRAFQPFWRAGVSSTRRSRGAGLGLALVAEYAKAMGGAAGVVSEPGFGSTFFVTLVPAGILPANDAAIDVGPSRAGSPSVE